MFRIKLSEKLGIKEETLAVHTDFKRVNNTYVFTLCEVIVFVFIVPRVE